MSLVSRMRQYQQQIVVPESPEQLVLKQYDLGIAACIQGDRSRVLRILSELNGRVELATDTELTDRLRPLYAYCIAESVEGSLQSVQAVLTGLREALRESVLADRVS